MGFVRQWIWRSFHRGIGVGDAIGGLLGNVVTFVAHVTPWGQSEMTDLAWQIPVFALAGAMMLRLFSTPYEMWREQKDRADGLQSLIDRVGEQRALQFNRAVFLWNPVPNPEENKAVLGAVEFHHSNIGQQMLRYTLDDVWVEVLDKRQEIEIQHRGVITPPLAPGHYQIQLPEPVEIPKFPVIVRLNFNYLYDTVPPVRARRSGLTVRYVLHGWKPEDRVEGMYFDDQRED